MRKAVLLAALRIAHDHRLLAIEGVGIDRQQIADQPVGRHRLQLKHVHDPKPVEHDFPELALDQTVEVRQGIDQARACSDGKAPGALRDARIAHASLEHLHDLPRFIEGPLARHQR